MKSGPRHPNGQIKRPSRDEREQNQLLVILSQPHRRGQLNPTDQKHASAFGRFCIRNKLAEEIYTASEKYASLVRAWRAAKGVPTTLRMSGSGKGGEGPSAETVEAWGERVAKIERAVVLNSEWLGFMSVRSMILDEIDGDLRLNFLAKIAAYHLAVEMGTLSLKDKKL